MRNIHERRLLIDFGIITLSVAVAVALVTSSALDNLFGALANHYIIAAFVAGLFFTSSFTTAPAIVILAKLSVAFPPFHIALVGALGALVGDSILFTFIRDYIAEDLSYVIAKSRIRRITHLLHYHSVRWLLAFVGALIIASPLPDELGLTLMGVSKISKAKFFALSYSFNFIGIILIAFVARSAVGI